MAEKSKQGKKKHKNKKTSERWKKYKINGDKITRDSTCPRCGPGIFLAKSKTGDRVYCGKCHYTEFATKEKTKESTETSQ